MNEHNTHIWFDAPAKDWNEALPLGNGRLGAMVYGGSKKGGVLQEQIQLNEDSLWSGGYQDRNNPDCYEHLEEIRRLIRAGEILQAQQTALYTMSGIPDSERCYQTLGDLYITHTGIDGEITGYSRVLALENASCTVGFTADRTAYTRTAFISQPDNVLVVRLTADKPGALSFHVKMGRDRFFDRVWTEDGCRIGYEGCSGGENGIRFGCMLDGSCDGAMSTSGEYLLVRGATEAVLRLTAATSFRVERPVESCREVLAASRGKNYETLWANHLAEYLPYFNATRLTLEEDGEDAESIPTGQRLARFAQTRRDNGLMALYYHFGRYLLIASSRPGTLPANLQGIWCHEMKPSWDSKFTININTEMNYWPAESCGLSQCHLPLFDHLKRMYPHGRETARKMYHVGGWVAHHNTDIWGDTAPQDTYLPATYWVMGAAWLCTHIWEHYLYTLDRNFLREHYYLMAEACRFFLDYLREDAKGRLVVSPTCSPENTYLMPRNGLPAQLCEGCAMDSQILTELFTGCIGASRILGEDPDFRRRLEECLARIPQSQIGHEGRVMEWLEEYQEKEPGHRHISHLYGLYPGHQIDIRRTPKLAAAARKTLEHRLVSGGGHTGWSRAWIINFWAQLQDAQKVQENLELLLVRSTLPNLFDNHPPFQIDGNFGGIAGISRAILQSSFDPLAGEGELLLFPALPEKWRTGSFTGVHARGDIILDITWRGGKLEWVRVNAPRGYRGTLRLLTAAGEISQKIMLKAGEEKTFDGALGEC